jgi:hypothetical protein
VAAGQAGAICVAHAVCCLLCCRSWGWPCLLSRTELRDYTKGWIQLSFKTAQQMSFASRPSMDKDALRMDQLEAGTLLSSPEKGQDSAQDAPEQQQEMHPQRSKHSMSAQTLQREPTSRQALVEATFKQLFPDDVQCVIPAQEYKCVNELLREWNRKLQVYIHAMALCELKRKRQKQKQKQQQAAAPMGDSSNAAASTQMVCIEVTSKQDRAAGNAAAGTAIPAAAGAGAASVSRSNGAGQPSGTSSSTGALGVSAQGPQPPQQPAMARPGRHSRNSSGCDSEPELSDSDEDIDCCTAAMRKMCSCACCGVGAIQDGGHGLLPPDGDVGLDSIGGGQARKRRCWGLFGRHAEEQEPKKASKEVLKEKQEELLELEAKILEEQKKVQGKLLLGAMQAHVVQSADQCVAETPECTECTPVCVLA